MTKDEIIEMARKAGARQMVSSLTHPNGPVTALKFDLDSESIKAFAKLVAAREREDIIWLVGIYGGPVNLEEAIRARGEA
jgi:hypothetical protein